MDLGGAIDLHVHAAPDVYPRSVDDVDLARQAKSAGMRALLLKSHHTLTADRASIASKVSDFPVFGGLALNLTVGGLNPVAVETAIELGARQVWMPTIHAAHCMATAEQAMFRAEAERGRMGITVVSDGKLTEPVKVILELVRDAGIALGTGHLAPVESLALLRVARDMNLQRLLVTHPLMDFTRFTVGQMREAVSCGALLEFDYLSCSPNWHGAVSPRRTAEAMRVVGCAHCVMATDGGQETNPPPPRMFSDYAEVLRAQGITEKELRLMMCDNPARLLGL